LSALTRRVGTRTHHKAEKKKKTRADLYRAVDADYYGFRDDEDGKLEELERAAEAAAVEAAVKEWEQATGKRRKLEDEEDNDEELSGANVFRVPSAEAVERALIERRKQVPYSHSR
jgi:pre-mRNA-splicing factor ISY1